MNDKEYNGWTNYETWLVKLWQDNEQGSQEYWRDQAEECVKVDGREQAVNSLSDLMREEYDRSAAEKIGTTGVFVDLIGAALHEVNWGEIACHWVDEAADALELEGVEIAA